MGIVRWSHGEGQKLVGSLGLPSKTATGVEYIEGPAGRAWRAANEFGLALRVFSGARLAAGIPRREQHRLQNPVHLVTKLIGSEDIQGVCARLASLNLGLYAPFTLTVSEPGVPTAVAEWDGRQYSIFLNGEPFIPVLFGPSQPANLMP